VWWWRGRWRLLPEPWQQQEGSGYPCSPWLLALLRKALATSVLATSFSDGAECCSYVYQIQYGGSEHTDSLLMFTIINVAFINGSAYLDHVNLVVCVEYSDGGTNSVSPYQPTFQHCLLICITVFFIKHLYYRWYIVARPCVGTHSPITGEKPSFSSNWY
jgi:hypothetical protein